MYKSIFLLFFLLINPLMAQTSVTEKAYHSYQLGEKTKDVEERKKAFNEALTLYLQIEPAHPSGKLSFNIANTYFQLGEYGYAILYYYKALKEMPRDPEVKANLEIAFKKAGIQQEAASFSYVQLSHYEKVIAILAILFIVFAIFSVHIWLVQPLLKWVAVLLLFLGIGLTTTLLWNEYFVLPEAVIVRSTVMRRDAGEQYAVITSQPCIPGVKVEVLSLDREGNWIKVRLSSGVEGYIPKESMRII